jgi:hypothetical protein
MGGLCCLIFLPVEDEDGCTLCVITKVAAQSEDQQYRNWSCNRSGDYCPLEATVSLL